MSIVWLAGPVALLVAALLAGITVRRLRAETEGLAEVELDLTALGAEAGVVRTDAARVAARIVAHHGAGPEPDAR